MSPPAENVELAPCKMIVFMFNSLLSNKVLISCTVFLNSIPISMVRGLCVVVGECSVMMPILVTGSCEK